MDIAKQLFGTKEGAIIDAGVAAITGNDKPITNLVEDGVENFVANWLVGPVNAPSAIAYFKAGQFTLTGDLLIISQIVSFRCAASTWTLAINSVINAVIAAATP